MLSNLEARWENFHLPQQVSTDNTLQSSFVSMMMTAIVQSEKDFTFEVTKFINVTTLIC